MLLWISFFLQCLSKSLFYFYGLPLFVQLFFFPSFNISINPLVKFIEQWHAFNKLSKGTNFVNFEPVVETYKILETLFFFFLIRFISFIIFFIVQQVIFTVLGVKITHFLLCFIHNLLSSGSLIPFSTMKFYRSPSIPTFPKLVLLFICLFLHLFVLCQYLFPLFQYTLYKVF